MDPDLIPAVQHTQWTSEVSNKRTRKGGMSRDEIRLQLGTLEPRLSDITKEKLFKAMTAVGVSGNSQRSFFEHYNVRDKTVLCRLSRDTLRFLCFARNLTTNKRSDAMLKKLLGEECEFDETLVHSNWTSSDYARLLLTMGEPRMAPHLEQLSCEAEKEGFDLMETMTMQRDVSTNPWVFFATLFLNPDFQPENPLVNPECLYLNDTQYFGSSTGDGDQIETQRRKFQDDINAMRPQDIGWGKKQCHEDNDEEVNRVTKVARTLRKRWVALNIAINTVRARHQSSDQWNMPGLEFLHLKNCGVAQLAALFAIKLYDMDRFAALKQCGAFATQHAESVFGGANKRTRLSAAIRRDEQVYKEDVELKKAERQLEIEREKVKHQEIELQTEQVRRERLRLELALKQEERDAMERLFATKAKLDSWLAQLDKEILDADTGSSDYEELQSRRTKLKRKLGEIADQLLQ